MDSYLTGTVRAGSGAAGLHRGPAGLVSPRALPSSDRLGDRGTASALPPSPANPGTLHKSKALSPVLCSSEPLCQACASVTSSLSLSPCFLIPGLQLVPYPQVCGEMQLPPSSAACEASPGAPPSFPLWNGGSNFDHSVPHTLWRWASDLARASVSHLACPRVGASCLMEPFCSPR